MKGWVLVTGAARRIGRAIAVRLAQEGWDVIVHYHRSSDEAAELARAIEDMGRKAVLAEIDLGNSEHVAKLVPSLVEALGPIRGLVNNASLFEPDAADPDGSRHWAVNADAPRLLSEAMAKQVLTGETASIVNILDGGSVPDTFSAYSRSKVALRSDTLAQARYFAPRVRVNGVAPGPVLPSPRQSAAHFAALVKATPLQYAITPEDIGSAVAFLLSAPAITGEILHVSGGLRLTATASPASA